MLPELKAALALSGTAVLVWDRLAGGSQAEDRFASIRQSLITAIGVLGFFAWWNLGILHPLRYMHVHEFFHYYLGAKYEPELGHAWLYTCTAATVAETSPPDEALPPWIRDLETNQMVTREDMLVKAAECPARFSPDRWKAFSTDVAWFRGRLPPVRWRQLLADHGFNATPVWTMAGTLIANRVPIGSKGFRLLPMIDPILLLVMWATIVWTFGWRESAVAALWWGTNYPARAAWIGGAFLRADWLLLAVVGVCLLRRHHPLAGGFALGYAALLRIFPGCLLVGVIARELAGMWRRRSWAPSAEGMRCLGGAVLAGLVLIPAASLAMRGRVFDADPWQAFAQNSRKHLSSASQNRMGLKALVSFDPAGRAARLRDLWLDSPGDVWEGARARVFEQRRPIFWVFAVGLVVLLVRAVDGRPLWLAAVLGTAIMAVLELACYYYALFLVFAFATIRRDEIAIGLSLLSAATSLAAWAFVSTDDQFLAISALTTGFAFAVLAFSAWVRDSPALQTGPRMTAGGLCTDSSADASSVHSAP